MGNRTSRVHNIPEALASPNDTAVTYTPNQATLLAEAKGFNYNINALVLEGGGAKAAGQIGCLQVLKDVGILKDVNRFAGTSAGALIAAMLALDHEPADIRRVHESMKRRWFMDAEGAFCAFIPNIFGKLGWNPGQKVIGVMQEVIKRKTGKDDITFMETYKRYKNELCVVAVNLSTMSVEYYHPKISPNMSLVTALRSSISIPILLQPVQTEGSIMVDGGVLCNFPLHAFDGWCLSMDPEDSFFNKIDSREDPFGVYNDRVLGVAVKNANDKVFQRQYSLEEVHLVGWDSPEYPNTKLARDRAKNLDKQKDHLYRQKHIMTAGGRFARTARGAEWSDDGIVKISDLKRVFNINPLSKEDTSILFGPNTSIQNIIDQLEKKDATASPGFVTFDEFIDHLRARSVALRSFMAGSMMANINSFTDLVRVIIQAMSGFSRMYFQKDRDDDRTISINVGYINTTDFEMEHADREFIIQQGVNSTFRFLKEKRMYNNNLSREIEETEIESIRL